MNVPRLLAPALVLLAAACFALPSRAQTAGFKVTPYLQLGPAPAPDKLQVLWHTEDAAASWAVEWRAAPSAAWQPASAPTRRVVTADGAGTRHVWRATMSGLPTGQRFDYRVLRNGNPAFQAEAQAPKGPSQPYTFVAIGDIADTGTAKRIIAAKILDEKPDLVVVSGDIVYEFGTITEYDKNFWPVYNAAEATDQGVPLMRTVPMVAAPGNHDLTEHETLSDHPDALAYYMFWDQPLNGPADPANSVLSKEGGPLVRLLQATQQQRDRLNAAAGAAYPRMANFSFDYGDTHWLVLDANPYVDWSNQALRDWVRKDLAGAKNARWRLALFHQPAYHSSTVHFNEQQMRALSYVLQQGGVDLVITGHVHNYQRSHPLQCEDAVRRPLPDLRVDYKCTADKTYDGKTNTKPKGVIHIVTGAGGAGLYDKGQTPQSKDYTAKYYAKRHSLTRVDVTANSLHVRQINADGDDVDNFTITR